jgi:universal stress protein E
MRLLTLKSILVATDLDDSAFPAAVAGVRLAGASGASLHLLHVTVSGDDQAARARADAELSALLERAGAGRDVATIHVLGGDPGFAIGSLSDRVHADVIVLGPHREGRVGGRVLGGTALAVVTNASCPCLVVKTPLRLPLSHAVVPIDLSDTARGALLVGLSWASALRGTKLDTRHRGDARLTALHVQPSLPDGNVRALSPAIEMEIAFAREAGGTWAGVAISGEAIANANVTQGIASFVADHAPDLVVIGTRGLGLDPVGRLGSVAASVLRSIDAPTLLVPPAVWTAHANSSAIGASRAENP